MNAIGAAIQAAFENEKQGTFLSVAAIFHRTGGRYSLNKIAAYLDDNVIGGVAVSIRGTTRGAIKAEVKS